jgi:hypothetical protein
MNIILKNGSSHAKTESSHAKTESSHAKTESSRAKNESSRAKNESSRAKTVSSRAKNESSRAKNESSRAKNESSSAKNIISRVKNENNLFTDFINQINRINPIKAAIFIILFTFITTFSVESFAQCTEPEGQIAASPVFVYDVNADSMIITVPVKNTGTAAFASPFKITVYKNDVGDAKRYTYNYNGVIAAGETANITFGVEDFKAGWWPFDTIKIRINDGGNGYNNQPVCDSARRDHKSVQLIASDDYVLIFNNSTDNQFRVVINDILPKSYVNITVNLLASPVFSGTATVGGSTIFYTPAAGKTADTIRYLIHCGNAEYADTATIYIKVMEKTDNVGDAECFIEPQPTVWGIGVDWRSPETNISEFIIPFVGDLDGDGTPEIVCFTTAGRITVTEGTNATAAKTIAIYDGLSKALKKTIELPSYVTEYDGAAYGLVRRPGDGKGLIVVATLDFKLRAYDITGALIWTSDVDYGSQMGDFAVNVGFADFNMDGIPEVYLRDKIYNASTGKFLAQVSSPSNTGSSWAHWTHNSVCWKLSSPLAADVLGDSKPELILGNEIYSVTIANPDGNVGNSINILRTATLPAGVATSDGHAQVADFNMDGHLDILITNRNTNVNTGGTVAVYLWDVYNNVTSQALILNTTWSGKNIPLIADVNNNNKLDIILQCDIADTNDDMPVYEYDAGTSTFKPLWAIDPDEDSYSNSATLFDFNLDGQNEVLITDQSKVRIFRGSDGVILNEFNFTETTVMQYPVIADVDIDGTADIVVCGGTTLNVLKSSGSPWAPARKVWNQYMYNAVNINENLTVPVLQFNSATSFSGSDGQLGTADDVRPYNNFLQQQTILSKAGTSYWEASDYAIEGIPNAVYYPSADSLSISFCVKNYGDIQGTAPFHVAIYKNDRQAANKILTKSFSNIPAPGQTVCNYSLKVENVLATGGLNTLHLWLNDEGGGASINPECDYTNGVVIYDITGDVSAENDYTSIFACEAISIPILANDEYFGTTFKILNTPKYGTVSQSGGILKYINNASGTSGLPCEQSGNRTDTVHYKIESLVSPAEAYAVVKIYSPPDIILKDACSANPKLVLSNSYDGFSYDWEHSLDGASGWTLVADDGGTELNAVKAGFYRVTINYENNKKYQLKTGVEVVANRITQLSGGIVWYDLSSNSVNINWQ